MSATIVGLQILALKNSAATAVVPWNRPDLYAANVELRTLRDISSVESAAIHWSQLGLLKHLSILGSVLT